MSGIIRRTLNALVAALGIVPMAGHAIVLNAFDGGWYEETGLHDSTNQNTLTGECCWGGGGLYESRSWFLFDLSSLVGNVTGATLRIELDSYQSDETSESITIRDVSAASTAAVDTSHSASSTEGIAIFDDLGTGVSYGSFSVDTPEYRAILLSEIIEVTFNATAVSDINAALGSRFAVGLALDEISLGVDPTGVDLNEYLRFGGSFEFDQRLHQLVLTGDLQSVPEPATLALFGLGLAGIAAKRRTKQSA